MYICAEGAATFDPLYYTWKAHPKVFCVIGTGNYFSQNWTDFRFLGRIMHRLCMKNLHGYPEYLFDDSWKDKDRHDNIRIAPCRPLFNEEIEVTTPSHIGPEGDSSPYLKTLLRLTLDLCLNNLSLWRCNDPKKP